MMCREIKFRAWDRKNVRMEYSGSRPSFGFWKWVDYDSSTPLMQYTGLKDKNGVEIYEGDVVRWWWDHIPEPHYGPNAVVRFGTIYEGDDHDRTGWVVDDCFVDEKCEVIGNIYENANLLREVDDDI